MSPKKSIPERKKLKAYFEGVSTLIVDVIAYLPIIVDVHKRMRSVIRRQPPDSYIVHPIKSPDLT